MTFNKRIPNSRLQIRTSCLECGWQGDWYFTPNEGLQELAAHLSERHPEILRDPRKLAASRRDEFRYVKEKAGG